MLTNDGSCACEIKSRIAVAKAAFNKKRVLFTSKMDLELRKKLVKCYIWSIALYGAETRTFRAVSKKNLASFEMWRWRRMEKVSWTDHVRNEVLLGVKEQRNILHEINKRKVNQRLRQSINHSWFIYLFIYLGDWFGLYRHHQAFQKDILLNNTVLSCYWDPVH
jgi:hypothetical protein